MEQLKLDLREPKSENLNIRIQPSLKAIFRDLCENNPTGPVDPSDLLRRYIVEYVQRVKSGKERLL